MGEWGGKVGFHYLHKAKHAEIFLEVKSAEANVYDCQSEDTICELFCM